MVIVCLKKGGVMGNFKIAEIPDFTKYETGKCPSYCGCLMSEWGLKMEGNVQRCVLCESRHDLKSRIRKSTASSLKNRFYLNFKTKGEYYDYIEKI
jgi:hypothetical protein